MRDNIPPGSDTLDAPWNEKAEPEMIEFEADSLGNCDYCGEGGLDLNKNNHCQDCYENHFPKYYNEEPDETPREDYDE